MSFMYTVYKSNPIDFLPHHGEAFIFYLIYSQYKQVLGNKNKGIGK